MRALIAEDEPVLRAQLKGLLATVWPELDVVVVAEDGLQAIQAIEQQALEVLFLDIQMPGKSGLDVARAASGRCHVVFVTAYDQYAVAAFEEGAVDYVMKPFNASRLHAACTRVKERLHATPAKLDGLLALLAERAAGTRPYLRWVNVSKGAEVRLLTVEEICYFRADHKYTLVASADGDALISTTLKELLDALDPTVFWQVHRGTIVNANAIATVARDARGQPVLKLKSRKETLQVSQPFAHRFRQM